MFKHRSFKTGIGSTVLALVILSAISICLFSGGILIGLVVLTLILAVCAVLGQEL